MAVMIWASTLFAATLPFAVHAACQVESLELPVRMVAGRAVATIGINGTQVPMTVDSGAFYSMLTDAAVAQLNLTAKNNSRLRVKGLTGTVEARTTYVEKLQLMKGDLGGTDFVVGGNEPGAGTMGLLGRNILSLTDTEYDFAHGVIRLLFPNDDCAKANMAYWAGSTPVTEIELRDDYSSRLPAIRADVQLNGKSLVAMFDSGATTMVTGRATRRAGVAEADWSPFGVMYGAGRGNATTWTAVFDRFEIGGETIRNNRLLVANVDVDGAEMLLGIDFFLSHRIYVSKKQSKMYITYNGGPVFALDKSATVGAPEVAAEASAGDAQIATADELARRGAASAARHDYTSALADLDRACDLEPTSAALFAQRGGVQQALKRPAKALEDYDKALQLDASQADARLQRAALRLTAKDRDGAKTDLDALDRTLVPQAQMRLPMSTLYLNLEQPSVALVQLNQWLAAHPNEVTRPTALYQRCWARALMGVDLDKAVDDCDDAIDGDAKNPVYLNARGWAYVRLGKYRKALTDFDRSIEYRAANASALYGRGLAKTRSGDVAEGDADLAAARKLQPNIDVRLKQIGLLTTVDPRP